MTTTAPPTNSNRGFILIVVALVAVGLFAVAFLAAGRDSGTDEQTAAVEVEGDALAPIPSGVQITDASTDPVAGTPAPTLVATGFDGSEVTIGPDGQPKAVYFLAHWCPHCQEEVPVVQDLIDQGLVPDGMAIYAVSTAVSAARPNFPPENWLDREGLDAIIVRDDDAGTAFASYGGGGFPYTVYLDGDNRVVARSSGNISPEQTVALWEAAAG